jgi:hypothetical protein
MICNDQIQLIPLKAGPSIVNYMFSSTSVPAVVPYCSSGWIEVAHVPPFESSQIDPLVVTALFGAGFLLYFTPWATAWGLSQMLKLLR